MEAGFVYVTDVKAAADSLRRPLPESLEPQVTYAAGVVEKARQPGPARTFVDGLTVRDPAPTPSSGRLGPAP